MKKTAILIGFSVILLWATSAFAVDMEYYTYGGFDPVMQAFNKIALIFSDSDYKVLLTIMLAIGIVVSVGMFIASSLYGRLTFPLSWLIAPVAGAVIYTAFFIPTGNLAIYDPVLNRTQTIGNIPDGVVIVAGFLNKIERSMIDIIDTSSIVSPDTQYEKTAGGIGYKTLESIRHTYPKNSYVDQSMTRFIRDCVSFELLRPGTTLSMDQLRNHSTDFLNDFDKAVNPAIFTVVYSTAHPEGETKNCQESWSILKPIYNNPNYYKDAIKRICGKSLFDSSSPVELMACQSLMEATNRHVTGGATVTPAKIIQQRLIAEKLYDEFLRGDPEMVALMESNKQLTTTGVGIGLTMNHWMPIIKAIMTAVAIGTLPFLLLFLPTPMGAKALSVVVGFFVFLATWGITDAVIHGAAMDYAFYAYEDMRQFNAGVYAMAALPFLATKMLAMYGLVRSAGIMLAGLFSMMIIKFGGSALAHLTTNLMSAARTAGASGGRTLTPEGLATATGNQAGALGMLGEGGFPDMSAKMAGGAKRMELMRNAATYTAAGNLHNSLIRSGQLPPGSKTMDAIQAQARSNMEAGTKFGKRSSSFGPDGGLSMFTDNSAAGRASYKMQNGKPVLTEASVNGINPMMMSETAMHQKITSAAHSLGSSTNWNHVQSALQRASLTNSHAATYSNALSNSIASGWTNTIKHGSGFMHSLDDETRKNLQGALSGGKALSKMTAGMVGGSASITAIYKDGSKRSFNISEDAAKKFSADQKRIRTEAISDTFGSASGLDYLSNLSKQIGASDAYSYLQDARDIQGSSETFGINAMTGFVRDYAVNRYGSDSPENIQAAISSLNDMAVHQGVQGKRNLRDLQADYIRRQGTGGIGIAADVQGSIQAGQSAAYGGGVRSTAGSAASRSAGETAGINQDSIHKMPDHSPLKDGTTTDDKIRFDNEQERVQNQIKENRQKELKSGEKIVTTGIKG